MKKFLFLTLIFSAIISTTSYAQPAGDPATILQQMKESIKPQMIEKTGLTEALADKVIEINFETRMAASGATNAMATPATHKTVLRVTLRRFRLVFSSAANRFSRVDCLAIASVADHTPPDCLTARAIHNRCDA